VVVPVLNRSEAIGRCIEALLEQDYPKYEVIIVDNGSTDGTRDIVAHYPVTLIVEERRNPYTARNRGIEAASGDIVAFTDSDCVPTPHWLSRLVGAYADDDVCAVGGRLLPLSPSNLVEEFLGFGRLQIFSARQRSEIRRNPKRFLSGGMGSANMSYRRSVLLEVGGFDEEFARYCGSYDLCWRVQARGYRVLFEPDAEVYHHMRSSVADMWTQFYALGVGEVNLLRKMGEGYSYCQLKLYLFSRREARCRLPFTAWVSLDALHGIVILLILALIWPALWLLCLPLAAVVAAGAALGARSAVKRSGRQLWYVLFPLLHIVRIYAQTAGRIVGGLRHGVLAF
jgi:GT2 family glycosyltransferase